MITQTVTTIGPIELSEKTESIKANAATQINLELQLRQTAWGAKIIEVNEEKLIMQLKRDEVPVLIQQITEMKTNIYSVHRKNSLEDYFLSLTAN